MVTMGTRLKELREAKGLTQEEVAKIINISRAGYCHYENDRKEPKIETLKILANFYNVSMDYLTVLHG